MGVSREKRAGPAAQAGDWYREGIHFACTQCGQCCTGGQGYVWVSRSEIDALARLVGLELDEFGYRYLRRVGQRYALLERPASGDCVFLVENRCSVYQARPHQCRSFPWWPRHLESSSAWLEAARTCEGIDERAPLIAYDCIKAIVDGEG